MRVGLVSCVKSKLATAAPARELYTSPLFLGARTAVERSCDQWFILSAKHGLLEPDEIVEPYERTLNDASRHERRAWSRRVLSDILARVDDVRGVTFEIHAGANYYDWGLAQGLRRAGATVELPLEGLSLGQRLSYYAGGAAPRPPRPHLGDHEGVEPTPPRTARTGAPGPTGKYARLLGRLRSLPSDRWDASFADVEAVLGFGLPASARRHPAWWSNNSSGHSHARAWLDAGFVTRNVDLAGERVTFVRTRQ